MKWPFRKTFSLTFFFRSGNSFTVDKVTQYSFENDGDTMTSIRIVTRSQRQLLVKTLALSQVEAVIVNRKRWCL